MLPSIFGESLFDDWMGFPFRAFDEMEKRLYGKQPTGLMKTDVTEREGEYEIDVDLPGFKKDQIRLDLTNGYLTIRAAKDENRDVTDDQGKVIRRERFAGDMQRSFYIGSVPEEAVKARFEDGVLTLNFPKQEAKKLPEHKPIMIEG